MRRASDFRKGKYAIGFSLSSPPYICFMPKLLNVACSLLQSMGLLYLDELVMVEIVAAWGGGLSVWFLCSRSNIVGRYK